jgi:hypothetical protein
MEGCEQQISFTKARQLEQEMKLPVETVKIKKIKERYRPGRVLSEKDILRYAIQDIIALLKYLEEYEDALRVRTCSHQEH